MNTVLNSYGQLCGCPEILKKSYKFFCRGLDIRVMRSMNIPASLWCCPMEKAAKRRCAWERRLRMGAFGIVCTAAGG